MSFVNYKDALPIVPKSNTKQKASGMNVRIDVVPVPTGTLGEAVTSGVREQQFAAIQKIKRAGKDLFLPNNTVVSTAASNKLYQTADLFNETTTVESLVEKLKQNNLTLRVNAIRTEGHSHTTCMNLTTEQLSALLEDGADGKNEKSCSITLPQAKDQGTMYIGVKVKRGVHYITKVDYEVNSMVDSRLHISS